MQHVQASLQEAEQLQFLPVVHFFCWSDHKNQVELQEMTLKQLAKGKRKGHVIVVIRISILHPVFYTFDNSFSVCRSALLMDPSNNYRSSAPAASCSPATREQSGPAHPLGDSSLCDATRPPRRGVVQ